MSVKSHAKGSVPGGHLPSRKGELMLSKTTHRTVPCAFRCRPKRRSSANTKSLCQTGLSLLYLFAAISDRFFRINRSPNTVRTLIDVFICVSKHLQSQKYDMIPSYRMQNQPKVLSHTDYVATSHHDQLVEVRHPFFARI